MSLLLARIAASGTPSGTAAVTNANDTASASGSPVNAGTVVPTNANDTSTASGTTTVVGTVARTNANDTSSATGSPVNKGTSATTNANDTASASGSVSSGVSGTANTTNANDTSAASGSPVVVGASATSNVNDLASAAGNSGTTPPEPDTGTHTGGRARPRRPQQPIPQPKRLPLLLPTIGGFASCENAADRCAAEGQVDPYNLLLEDEELLLLV
jgi:hypothetical protein